MRRIENVYGVEAKVRGRAPAERLAWRWSLSAPLVKNLRAWLEAQLSQLPARNTLAEAIRHALGHLNGLTRFLDHDRIALDTNPVKRAIRPVALGRTNHLMAGSDGGGHHWRSSAR